MVDTRRTGEHIDEALIVEVARAYYLEERSQVEIAAQTGLSRWQVARTVKEARTRGIVTIRVNGPERAPGVVDRLEEQLGLRRVVVADAAPRGGKALRADDATGRVAAALGRYLAESVHPGESLGLGWSRAIEALPAVLAHLSPCEVVQMAGALTFSGDRVGSVEVVRQVARIAGGTAHPIYAPLVAPSEEIANELMQSPDIERVLRRAERVDHAVVGIGTWTSAGSSILPLLPMEIVRRTSAAGATAVISGRVIDRKGVPVDAGADDRIVSLSLDQIGDLPHVIGTCVGAHRVEAVRAAVRSGLFDALVVDDSLAGALLHS